MYVACIHVEVLPNRRDEFIRATMENARNTVQEPGNLRFDIIQDMDNPNKFMLYEAYRDVDGMVNHKKTTHYLRWRDNVASLFAKDRQRCDYYSLFPEKQEEWETLPK